MTDNEDLKPCPCCGSGAYFAMVENDGLIDGRAGGWFVECINPECRLTTQLMFVTGDDPRPRLREIWNKRHNAGVKAAGTTNAKLTDQPERKNHEQRTEKIIMTPKCPDCGRDQEDCSCRDTQNQPIPEGYKLVPDAVISSFPEINPSNYNHEDVCTLNDWGTQLVLAASSEVKP